MPHYRQATFQEEFVASVHICFSLFFSRNWRDLHYHHVEASMLPYFSHYTLGKIEQRQTPCIFKSNDARRHHPWDQVTINKLNKKMVVQMTKMPQLMIQSNMSWCHDISTYIYPVILEDVCVFCSSSNRLVLGKKMKKTAPNTDIKCIYDPVNLLSLQAYPGSSSIQLAGLNCPTAELIHGNWWPTQGNCILSIRGFHTHTHTPDLMRFLKISVSIV